MSKKQEFKTFYKSTTNKSTSNLPRLNTDSH